MFSVQQKIEIANKVQAILRETHHPELPEGEIRFLLHVFGAKEWSWADIKNNGDNPIPQVNPWDEHSYVKIYRYIGTKDKSLIGKTALGFTDGKFYVQVDQNEHPWSQDWWPTNRENWEKIDV